MQARVVAVVGGGPAGLRAAQVAALAGAEVTLYEGQRSAGRKFLIAGKSGLNLTSDVDLERLLRAYNGADLPTGLWREILTAFDGHALREWARQLGIETFVAKGDRVLPKPINGQMKSTPLLRRWLAQLREIGVTLRNTHRWCGLGPRGELLFEHGTQTISVRPDATVLALGGGSWPRTGSDAAWVSLLAEHGVEITPLRASNCGWNVSWPADLLLAAEGLPLKNLSLRVGDCLVRGELIITRHGLEGGPLYRAGPTLRAAASPELLLDFKPDSSAEQLLARMGGVRHHFVREAGRRLKLDPGTCALLKHMPGRGPWKSSEQIVAELKHFPIALDGPRPIAEAISSAGGIAWNELDSNLMIRRLPGVFVAGEMIDWDAPTGGYLLQACFATGTHAGRAAARASTRAPP